MCSGPLGIDVMPLCTSGTEVIGMAVLVFGGEPELG